MRLDEINERNLEWDPTGTSRSISRLQEMKLESSDDEDGGIGPRLKFLNYDHANPIMLS